MVSDAYTVLTLLLCVRVHNQSDPTNRPSLDPNGKKLAGWGLCWELKTNAFVVQDALMHRIHPILSALTG